MNFHSPENQPPVRQTRTRNRGPHKLKLVLSSQGITKKMSKALYHDVCLILSKHALGSVVSLKGTVPGVPHVRAK